MRNNVIVRQQMLEMVDRWEQSNLSQRSFCEKEGIKFHKFYYWYRRYRQPGKAAKVSTTPGFVKLKIGKPLPHSSIEMHFPQGVRLIFHEAVSAAYLKTLLI